MTTDYIVLIIGIIASTLFAFSVGYLTWTGSGERQQIEASLRLLDREIREWTRLRKGDPEEEPVLLQLLHALNPIGRRIVTKSSLRDLERQVVYAGNPPIWTVANILSMKVLSVIIGVMVAAGMTAISTQSLLYGLAIMVVGYEAPDLIIRSKATSRQNELRRGLPDALDLLTVTVEAGLGFDAAVHQVVNGTSGPAAGELMRYLQEKQLGASSAAALESLGTRTTVDELKSFTVALQQAERLGISIGTVLRELTREMRIKRRQYAQERAQKVPVKILGPMMLFIFPVIFIVVLAPAVIGLIGAFD